MSAPGLIYLDHAGTTPMDPRVFDAMRPYFTELYGNPSSVHTIGQEAKYALDNARERVAEVLACRSSEVVFTSGGTEADNAALHGVATALHETGNHLITSGVEHHAVLHTCQYLENRGYEVTYLPVDEFGMISPESVYNAIGPRTTLVSIMYANNEIGTINPIADIAAAVRRRAEELDRTIVLHTDAVQAAGFLDLNVRRLGVDMLSLSGHKFLRPQGNRGALPAAGDALPAVAPGRAGRNGNGVPGRKTLPASSAWPGPWNWRMGNGNGPRPIAPPCGIGLFNGPPPHLPDTALNGHPTQRLPNNVNFSFPGVEGESILLGLDMKGIAASSGSACSSGSLEPSHVLLALGQTAELARSSLRITLGKENTDAEVEWLLAALADLVPRLRAMPTLTTAGY